MQTSILFIAKNLGFFEIFGVSVRIKKEGVKPLRTFFGKGRLVFCVFVRTSLMDGS